MYRKEVVIIDKGENKMTQYIYADRFYFKSGVQGPGYLPVLNTGVFGRFQEQEPKLTAEDEVLDYTGYWIAPGLVDTHIHGFLGHDVMDNDREGILAMSEGLVSCGVTSFLPTTLTADATLLTEVAKTVSSCYKQTSGAKIAGIYFEGPFFTEEHKGAQNPSYFSAPSLAQFNVWQEAAQGLIKKIALAPEHKGAQEFIQEVTASGVVVALGHSHATYDEAKGAVDAGASVFVHTYNGMRGFNHREPGMVGAALSLKETYAELICDGEHVHPVAANVLKQSIGAERVALITDCMRAGGMPEGDYMLGEFPVTVEKGTARLQSGNLAGSILQLKEAVYNVVDWNMATVEEAFLMSTYVPAVSSGIDDVCGQIAPGYAADFTVWSPDLTLQATYVDGVCRYQHI